MPFRVGDITASSADDDDLHLVGALTGLTRATVLRRCREAHGNMLLRNVFDDRWPNDADDLEDCTVALARDAGLDLEIADVTGLSERTVGRRLREEPGNMLVGTAFSELYQDEDEDDGEDDSEDDDDADQVADDAEALDDIEDEWSRPRKITRIMSALGFEVVERLRSERFQEVVRAVRAAGVAMCLADDDDVLDDDAPSPGIHAKVRLRRIAGHHAGVERAGIPSNGPTQVVVTPSSPQLREQPGQVSASSYELALMRLELLTALPSLDREHSPLWPHAFIDAASRGLALEVHQQSILKVVAQNFRRGFHDAVHVAASLRPRISAVEWDGLLVDFARLNADSAAAVQVVLDHLRTGPSTREAEVSAQRLAVMPQVEARPAATPLTAAATPGAGREEKDGRDLGALEDMFD